MFRDSISWTTVGCLLGIITFISHQTVLGQTNPGPSVSYESAYKRADGLEAVRSLLIQKNGELVAERYFDGQSPGTAMNMKSASKSIISLLVGIAIDKGFIENKEQEIHQYFPEYFEDITDSLKYTITIEDLLTMRSGLESTSIRNYGRWVISDDWVEYALEQPMEDTPGEDMEYSTGSSHLLSVIIQKATDMTTSEFAEEYLFGPLDIERGGWQQDPQGYYFGGNNLALRPADMVKIGQMVLNGGMYNGQRIVSQDWLAQSFQTYTRSNYNPYDYGYMWWNRTVADRKVYFAWGHGGQYIFIIPDLDSVVVITSSLLVNQSRGYQRRVFSLLGEDIIPLLERPSHP